MKSCVNGNGIDRTNPAWLKLDLYCKGIRLSEGCLPKDTHGRPILRTRAGLGSGIELILPENLWTNVPVTEEFAADSPYELIHDQHGYFVHYEGERLVEVGIAPRPLWYDQQSRSGKRMDRIGTLQGTYLAIYPAAVCEYWKESPRVNCRFCSVGLNLGYDDADDKTIEDIMDVVHAAREETGITYVDFNTGHYTGETYLDILEPMIRRIKAETDLFIGVQTPPHHDLSRYDRLQAIGVNRVSFCFELFDQDTFEKICPGKNREYGLQRYLDAVEYCAQLSRKGTWKNPWVANGEIIVGLEPPEASIRAIDWMTSIGAIPTVCVFRPLKAPIWRSSLLPIQRICSLSLNAFTAPPWKEGCRSDWLQTSMSAWCSCRMNAGFSEIIRNALRVPKKSARSRRVFSLSSTSPAGSCVACSAEGTDGSC
ncbi:MAG: Radical SAM superfamily protein [Candidatus Hinthialibacteria bacterium OLB16]|nr:MAG: Radical SAM superfamily protein [Candidatus Hinthialibacteria bacterium OLB16]